VRVAVAPQGTIGRGRDTVSLQRLGVAAASGLRGVTGPTVTAHMSIPPLTAQVAPVIKDD